MLVIAATEAGDDLLAAFKILCPGQIADEVRVAGYFSPSRGVSQVDAVIANQKYLGPTDAESL